MSCPTDFTSEGMLPPGDHELTLAGLRASLLVAGPSHQPHGSHWDADWRRHLVDELEVMARQLWSVGIRRIFLDGSFAEDKEHPNDIDGYFECRLGYLISGDLERELNLLHPDKVWTWKPDSRRSARGFTKKQLPMWHRHRVELYPHYGQPSGIRDGFGNELEFPSAFRLSRRDGRPRGVIRLMPDAETSTQGPR